MPKEPALRPAAKRRGGLFPRSEAPATLWFGVHFPHLGLEIFERRQADAAGLPLAVIANGRVQRVNKTAAAAGVMPGSTLATASSISPNLKYFDRDLDAEQERLHDLAQASRRYTSRISLCAPDGLVLEAGASLGLFGGAHAIAAQLKAQFRRVRHVANIAGAATPAAALALAHWGRGCERDAETGLAGGDDANARDGAAVARSGLKALHDAPLACATIEPRDIERLADMGIFRIGQLLALPRDELAARFGPALPAYLARLVGEAPDVRPPVLPQERFAASIHLIESISGKEALRFPMRRLAADLAAWLQARQLGVLRLAWRFQPLRGDACRLEARFAEARANVAGMLGISQLKIERAALPEEVMSIGLKAIETAPLAGGGVGLFANAATSATPWALVDEMAARLGNEALGRIATADDHRPEFAWKARSIGERWPAPAKGVSAQRSASKAAKPKAYRARRFATTGERPLWLLHAPKPVQPERFRLLSGPERIESGWWQEAVARDYHVAVDENGVWCWLYVVRGFMRGDAASCPPQECPPKEKERWFLHGYFA